MQALRVSDIERRRRGGNFLRRQCREIGLCLVQQGLLTDVEAISEDRAGQQSGSCPTACLSRTVAGPDQRLRLPVYFSISSARVGRGGSVACSRQRCMDAFQPLARCKVLPAVGLVPLQGAFAGRRRHGASLWSREEI